MKKQRRAAVLGLGFVGLNLALALADAGYQVLGIDRDPARVQSVREGQVGLGEAEQARLEAALSSGSLEATVEEAGLGDASVILLALPTPLDPQGWPDLRAVRSGAAAVAQYLRRGQLVCVESSLPPGTTEGMIRSLLEETGLRAGKDFFLACSPERLDPGNERYHLANTPKLLSGVTPACTRRAERLYRRLCEQVVTVSSPRVAETAKLFENTFRYVNVALVQELAEFCRRIGVESAEVIDAAASKPFGFMPFRPGPGPGGTCVPVSPWYLAAAARETGMELHLVEAAAEVNRSAPRRVAARVLEVLEESGRSPAQGRVLVLGVTYKRDVAETRNSPAVEIMGFLIRQGIHLLYHDPFVSRIEVAGTRLVSTPLTPELLDAADCVVILADHSVYDPPEIVARARRVVDARQATRGIDSPKIVRV